MTKPITDAQLAELDKADFPWDLTSDDWYAIRERIRHQDMRIEALEVLLERYGDA
jgi:hypothetical protein